MLNRREKFISLKFNYIFSNDDKNLISSETVLQNLKQLMVSTLYYQTTQQYYELFFHENT